MFGLRGEKTFGFGHIWWERIPSQGGGCIACAVCVAACSWSASEGTICIEWRRLDLTWDKNMAGQVASQSDHGHRDELIGRLVSACDKLYATHDLNCFLQVYSVQHSNPCLSHFGTWDWEEGQSLPFGNIWPNSMDDIHWTSLYGCQSSLTHNYNHVLTLWMKQVLKCIKAAS